MKVELREDVTSEQTCTFPRIPFFLTEPWIIWSLVFPGRFASWTLCPPWSGVGALEVCSTRVLVPLPICSVDFLTCPWFLHTLFDLVHSLLKIKKHFERSRRASRADEGTMARMVAEFDTWDPPGVRPAMTLGSSSLTSMFMLCCVRPLQVNTSNTKGHSSPRKGARRQKSNVENMDISKIV